MMGELCRGKRLDKVEIQAVEGEVEDEEIGEEVIDDGGGAEGEEEIDDGGGAEGEGEIDDGGGAEEE